MRKALFTLTAAFGFVWASLCSAHIEDLRSNPYANGYISFVGEHHFHGPAGSLAPERFKVRVFDRLGRPVPNARVIFGTDRPISIHPIPSAPDDAYGEFLLPAGESQTMLADSDGVATSPPFRFGTQRHNAIALAMDRDWVTIGRAYFHLNVEGLPEPPLGPIPAAQPEPSGTLVPVALPSTTSWGLWILGAGMMWLASGRMRIRKLR